MSYIGLRESTPTLGAGECGPLRVGHRPPYRRGYQAPASLRAEIATAHRTRLGRTVLAAAGDHAVIAFAAGLVAARTRTSSPRLG